MDSTLDQLKKDYIARVEQIPFPDGMEDIREHLLGFTTFDREQFCDVSLSTDDEAILFEVGLPSEYTTDILFDRTLPNQSDVPNQIGSTSAGDPVCLRSDGVIVCLNHDNDMEEAFVNSSVRKFLECAVALLDQGVDLSAIDPGIAGKTCCYWTSTRKHR